MYHSSVQSKLLYGILLLGTDLIEATQIQKKTTRIVTSSPFLLHTEPLFNYNGILKVNDLYLLSILKVCHKLYSYDLDVINHTCSRYNLRHLLIRKPKHFHSFATNNLLFGCIQAIENCSNCIVDTLFTHSFRSFAFCKYV